MRLYDQAWRHEQCKTGIDRVDDGLPEGLENSIELLRDIRWAQELKGLEGLEGLEPGAAKAAVGPTGCQGASAWPCNVVQKNIFYSSLFIII